MLGTFLSGRCARSAGAAILFCAALIAADAAQAAKRRGSHGGSHHAATPAAPTLDAQAVNDAQFTAPSGKGRARAPSAATIIKEEILLDRAGFSPGEIDGQAGSNDQKALAAFQQANGLKATGRLDADTWSRLTATSSEPVLREYEIEQNDVKGPFNKTIPASLEKKAELKTLNYTNVHELLGEKFHINPGLLSRLNPKASLETAGTKIMVPNVSDKAPDRKVDKVVVDKTAKTVRAFDGSKQVTFYPASVGSEERPAPSGERRVRSVTENPTYHYSPKLKFKGVKSKKPFTVAAGPKNPVGTTWIDLGDSYGIHGTPAPERISKTESHGCVRLTNWDAQQLAKMVHRGTKVEFIN